MSSEYHPRLCVLRLTALGDCINAFGLLGALARTYPDIELTWVIDERFSSLFCDEQGHDLIPMLKVNFKERGLKAILDLKSELKDSLTYDALLNLQTSLKASLTSTVIPARKKYGYDKERGREGQHFFVTDQVPSPENPHVLAGFMAFAEAAGFPISEPYWDFKLDPYQIDRARCLVSHEKVCAIAPCSAKPSKNWTVEGYVEVARLAQSHNMQVVLLGSHSKLELETCQAIAEQVKGSINLCGRTNLRELAALLSISKLVVAPDSASMHLASALGTPVIGLFAIHDDARVGPWNFMDLNVSVYRKLAKAELKGKEIPWRYRVRTEHAMERITPEMVCSTFEQALERYRI